MKSWEFYNPSTDESIEVEAPSFDEATNILFGEWEYEPNEWSFLSSYSM